MNMADLYRMLDEGLLDFVVGVAGMSKGPWATTPLYKEPLLFVPRGAGWSAGVRKRSVRLAEISAETCVMVPDDGVRADHLVWFSKHLETVVPGIVAGLDAGLS
jgi:hypothetical protein